MKNGNQAGLRPSAPIGPVPGNAQRHPLDWPAKAGAVDDVLQEINVLLKRRRRRSRRLVGSALGLLVVGLAAYFTVRSPLSKQWTSPASAVLSHPERQKLPDGSMVEFRSGAKITVAFT